MAEPPLQKSLLSGLISDDLLLQCMHCGMCLPSCPTYNVTKLESSSPRGRIRLIKSVSEGKLEINDTYLNEISFCLDCQACETACPAGVKYGAIVEAAREEVSRQNLEPLKVRTIRRFGLNFIVANQPILKIVARLIYFYQASGLQKFLHNIGMFKIMGGNLGAVDQMSPKFSKRFSSDMVSEIYTPAEPVRYRVLLPLGCLMDVAFADINSDTLDVLLQHGCEVIIPRIRAAVGLFMPIMVNKKREKSLLLKPWSCLRIMNTTS
ncbi:MAG: (Fe-S)-binding protein [Ignavibacteriales bacterium]|nr:(Fe-S)-binding protein [Ignavibacteriales bacterium]